MRIVSLIVYFFLSLFMTVSYAASLEECSDAVGKATLNEVYKLTTGNGTASFIEIKILDKTLASAIYDEWTLQICYRRGCVTYNVSDFSGNAPWLYIQTPALNDTYIDFKGGFDISLRGDVTDNGGADSQEIIDYLVVKDSFNQDVSNCKYDELPDWGGSLETNNGTKLAKRIGDGTGDWVVVNANDESETPGANNEGITFDHFEINHDGQGLTCQAENITIKACADATCSTLNNSTVDVALSINGVFAQTVTVSGGSSTTSFSYTDSVTPATLSLNESYTCKNGGSTSCDIVFAEAGFVLDINGGDDVASCDDSQSLAIKAVKLSDNGVSCAPAFTGNQLLNFVFNYQNPNTGTIVPMLSGTSMEASGVSENRTITFNSDGEALLPIQYDDAGQLSFSVAEVVSSGVSAATIYKVFYPSKLVVSTPLSSIDSNGTVKQVAGENFPINITAQCQGGTVTKNYSPQSISTLQLSVQQKEPKTNTGVLAIGSTNISATNNVDLATASWGNTNQTALNFNGNYSEVGIINLAAQDISYFGHTINSAGYNSAGRFIPDHFDVAITHNSFDNTCAVGADLTKHFTYIGQPFSYLLAPEILITAKNKSGQTTKNYTESGYQKLVAANIKRIFPVADSSKDGTDNATKMTVLPEDNVGGLSKDSDGVLKYTFSELDKFTYEKDSNSETIPFTAQYNIVIETIKDSDDVNASASLAADEPSSNTVSPTGVNLRFGRWYIENSFGPETSDLPMPMAIQYWNGTAFTMNTDDNCTAFDGDTVANYSLTLNDLNKPLSATNLTPISGNGIFALGLAELKIDKPSDGSQGQIRLTYDNTPAWLQYDWSWNGTDVKEFNQSPSGVATFGLFRGNDRIIYQREVH